MDIHTLLSTTAKPESPGAGASKSTGLQGHQGFAHHFGQASTQAAGLPTQALGQTPGDAGASQAGLVVVGEQGLGQGKGNSPGSLAPLTQGIAKASGLLNQGHDLQTLLSMLPLDDMPADSLSPESLGLSDNQPGQQQLQAILERMNLIDSAGQLLSDAEMPEPSMTATLPQQVDESALPNLDTSDDLPEAGHSAALLAALNPESVDATQRQANVREASRHQTLTGLSSLATQQAPANEAASQGTQPVAPAPQAEAVMRDSAFVSQLGRGEDGTQAGKESPSFSTLHSQSMGSTFSGATATATAQAAPQSAVLSAPVGTQQWQQHLSQQVVGLHQRGGQQIELHLNPAELGPLSISLKMGEQGAQAHFLSAHAQVRAAIEQAIPQLREALEEQGISLGEAMVGEHPQQQQQEQPAFAGAGQMGTGSGTTSDSSLISGEGTGEASMAAQAIGLNGRVDLYA